ncbi:MAG: squalene/phytoene synthase family protein [Planctomycetota bacterium]
MSRRGHWARTPAEFESIRVCRAITCERAANFAYGLRLAREPKRSALYALYAWTRLADDIADGPGTVETRAAALEAYAERTHAALDLCSKSGPHDEPNIWPAFTLAASAYAIDRTLLDALIEGLRSDLSGVALETEHELETYCYRVASTVGLMCVSIWGLRTGALEAEAARLAALRGRAFQLTNVLRDFAEDYDSTPRRVYLPRASFEAAGLTPESLRRWNDPRASAAFIERRVGQARHAYETSEALDQMVSMDGRPVLRAMTSVYRTLLERVAATPRAVAQGPSVRVPRKVKVWIAARTVGGASVAKLVGGSQ